MKRARAFTLTDALVVIGVIVVLLLVVGIMIPARGGSHHGTKTKNGMQLKDIVTAFSTWSEAHSVPFTANASSADFPGSIAVATGNYPRNATDPGVVARFWALVAAPGIDPLNPKLLVNPVPGVPEMVWSNPKYTIKPGVTTAAEAGFSANSVSYALLATNMGSEWRDNNNTGCPMICDRNRGTPAAPQSTWSSPWTGSVGWGDGHATFEISPNFAVTIYGNSIPNNNIWAPATSSNAGMVNPGD
jgi:hypothetical protein